ncbi:phage tail protein I [Geodermatophilus marinus]|uniref:phage tail protein I n=1 Tax=Geodermatophilus sp. LHW52908 TaxID=2303986 RepID=UPI000E3DB584|nr:phage tail protein I [Geodermatophilus sp. LHW52908]RFU18906.1 phage tail protein I [Geodermatophilus sp. LHW52908]
MRGTLPGLATPFPLGPGLPGLYQDDDLVQRLCAALDEVLAPVVTTLDCLPAYLDPATAPADLVDWLAGWVGVALDDVPPARRRRLVATAAVVHRRRGTLRGVREALTAWFGVAAEVTESGGAAWSAEPGAALPGSAEPFLLVRIRVADLATVDVRRVDALVAAVKPAHVPHRVEVVQ